MPRLLRSTFGIIALASSIASFGLGCSSANPEKQNAEIQAQLRQPAPASAPTKQPEIPPEAAKVPRPY
ncbi:MAG: hypothetical protein ABIO72_01365 [Patescibacteria group bacterium]